MPQEAETYDVAVIGGGPGGSMASTLLADAGRSVVLFEASTFPRYHIGESLLPATLELLSRIGVLDRLESEGYTKKHGVEWVWGGAREPWTTYFKDALAMPYDFGYQVERAQFDEILLRNASAHGVDVREQHKVTDFDISENAAAVTCSAHGGSVTIHARWIVDASGQGGTVTKRLHEQQWDPYLKNMAVWTYWKGAHRSEGLDAGNTFTPTFSGGWWWFIPLRDDITSVGMVVDRRALADLREGGLEKYYDECLAATPELASRLRSAEKTAEVRAARDWSYVYDQFGGDGYVAVGDAACFIDPLFSTGVHLAMLSGFLAAATVNTVLDGEVGQADALAFYETAYRNEFARLRAQVHFLYSGHGDTKDSYFWHARSQFDVPGVDPEQAFISLIAGAFQHQSWYNRYLGQLDVPDELRQKINSIFDGSVAGLGISPSTKVATTAYKIIDDLAIDGLRLRPSKSISTPSGASLALTAPLEMLLELADGSLAPSDLVDKLVRSGSHDRVAARGLVHEALSYGLLAPATTDH